MDAALRLPGISNAWTMPIKGRLDMLSTGIRTPIGIKISGADLDEIQKVAVAIEAALRKVPGTRSVYAERVSEGFFLDFLLKRDQLARYGLSIDDANAMVLTAVGGEEQSVTVEGRERYGINVRYARDYREDLSALRRVLLPLPQGGQIPMEEIADVGLVQGPSMIRNENGLLAGYVYVDFDTSKVDIGSYVDRAKKAVAGAVQVPPGYSMSWSGQYENMLRVRERLKFILPVTLFLIFGLLFLNTRSRGEGGHRAARSPLLRDRRRVAALAARVQRLHRGLGGDDRPHGARRRDRRLHAPFPRPRPRRGEGCGAAQDARATWWRPSSTAR